MSQAILVVEDDELVRTFVQQVLERSGFEVESAVDGVVALEKLSLNRYDAVVLDVMMPRMDGFGVIRFLEANDASILPRIVVATAYPRDAAKLELRDIGRVLVKPFDAERLLNAVRECVGTPNAADGARAEEGRPSN